MTDSERLCRYLQKKLQNESERHSVRKGEYKAEIAAAHTKIRSSNLKVRRSGRRRVEEEGWRGYLSCIPQPVCPCGPLVTPSLSVCPRLGRVFWIGNTLLSLCMKVQALETQLEAQSSTCETLACENERLRRLSAASCRQPEPTSRAESSHQEKGVSRSAHTWLTLNQLGSF